MVQVENTPSDHSPENPPENQPPSDSYEPNTNGSNSFPRHKQQSKVMENCIALFLKFGAAASPTKTLSPKQKALIEQRLVDSFHIHHRPNHLPYAAMIETAIVKLNEKDGSSEEAISHFIRKENHDLPWAHDMFVKHHLDNLCKDGSIFKTRYGLYTTTTDTDPSILSSTSDSHSSSNSDSDASVSQIPAQKRTLRKGRLSWIKVETKVRRLRRMNKERNQLQEHHNVAPVREQCHVKKSDQELPKGNRKGQKARLKPAGRGMGKRGNNNELSVNELNDEQKLIEVLNAIKRDKKGKVLVERQSEHNTRLRSLFAEETENVKECGKHEAAIVARKGEVVVGKDEKLKQHVIVFGLFSPACTFGTKCSIVDLKPVKKKNPFSL